MFTNIEMKDRITQCKISIVYIRYFCLNQKSLYGNQKLLLVAILCHTICSPILKWKTGLHNAKSALFTSQSQYIVLVCESAMRIKLSLFEQSGDIRHQACWLAKFFQINKVISNINGILGLNQNLMHQCRHLNELIKLIAGSFIRYFCLNQKSLQYCSN